MVQYAFHVDSSVCTGCKTCQIACQDKNDLAVDILWRKVYQYGGGGWVDKGNGIMVPTEVFRYFLSIACNHCENPTCVEACPTGAMQKDADTGIVWTDHEECIACESCSKACPYDAPKLDTENGYMTKCDFCKDQLSEDGKPECVAACNQRALDWGPLDDLLKKYPDFVDGVEPLPEPTTNPSLLITAHPKARLSGEGGGAILNMEYEL